MADNSDILQMDDDTLLEEWTKAAEEALDLKARLSAFSLEHQKRTRMAQLNLEPGDAALIQEMTTTGIESAEAVQTGEEA